MVVKKEDDCIGGARIILSYPNSQYKIPLENNNFSLQEVLPDLSVQNSIYCEFSRLILLPEYQNGLYSIKMLEHLTKEAVRSGCRFIFGEATYVKARRYRLVYNMLGLNLVIRKDIRTPLREIYQHYESPLELYLIYVDLENQRNFG